MTERRVACIVEGHGEKESVPLLLRRIQSESEGLLVPDIRSGDVLRIPKSKLVKPGELERAIDYAARKVGEDGAVLVVLDADDSPGCQLGPELLQRALGKRPDMRIGVVVACREYEAWFLASPTKLFPGRTVSSRVTISPEEVRDAKGQLRQALGRYQPVRDQPALTSRMDLAEARQNSRSFDKMWREVHRLLEAG